MSTPPSALAAPIERLRAPLFVVALALLAVVVLIEVGAADLLKGPTAGAAALDAQVRQHLPDLSAAERQAMVADLERMGGEKPPGLAIRYLALLDGLVLFTVALIGVALVLPAQVHGRLQGCATFIVTLVALLGGIVMIFVALGLVLAMVALLLSVPFGTIIYFAVYGFFNRTGAGIALGLLMLLKLGFGACLVLAHQRFLQNWGLVLIVLTSLLGNVIISLLHGFPPGFLVSITDGIAAIVVAILAVIWALVLLVGSLAAVVTALRPS
jgi:hypothetical protein